MKCIENHKDLFDLSLKSLPAVGRRAIKRAERAFRNSLKNSLTNIKLKGINKSIEKKRGRWKDHGLWNETSQSKKDDKESYQEEIVISGVLPPIEAIFFS